MTRAFIGTQKHGKYSKKTLARLVPSFNLEEESLFIINVVSKVLLVKLYGSVIMFTELPWNFQIRVRKICTTIELKLTVDDQQCMWRTMLCGHRFVCALERVDNKKRLPSSSFKN